jgi:hypothetical protein
MIELEAIGYVRGARPEAADDTGAASWLNAERITLNRIGSTADAGAFAAQRAASARVVARANVPILACRSWLNRRKSIALAVAAPIF